MYSTNKDPFLKKTLFWKKTPYKTRGHKISAIVTETVILNLVCNPWLVQQFYRKT